MTAAYTRALHEIAALLLDLAQTIDNLLDDVGLPHGAEKNWELIRRARNAADQLAQVDPA